MSNITSFFSQAVSFRAIRVLCTAIIIIAGLFVYSSALECEFIGDDHGLVAHNTFIRDWHNIGVIFTQPMGAGYVAHNSAQAQLIYYRPLQTLTYMIDHMFWGLRPAGYHLTNILWHIAAALGVYMFLRAVTQENILASFAAFFFLLCPAHTEAVCYVSGRADLMAVCFMSLSVAGYIHWLKTKNARYYVQTVLFLCAALLTKETALMVIPFLFLYHVIFRCKVSSWASAGLIAIGGSYLLWHKIVMAKNTFLPSFLEGIFQRVPGFFVAVVSYFNILLFPHRLLLGYKKELFLWNDPRVWAGIFLFAVLIVIIMRQRQRDPRISYAAGFIILSLMPVANIFYPLPSYMAVHYLYVPSIGFFLLISLGLERLSRSLLARRIILLLAAGYAIFYSYQISRHIAVWHDAETYYTYMLESGMDDLKAYEQLAFEYHQAEQWDKAIAMYHKVLELAPDNAFTYNNLGVIYARQGDVGQAIAFYEKAIACAPDYARAHGNVALLYYARGDHQKAREHALLARQYGYNVPMPELKSHK